ncbi:MAG: type IIA DNA topoisomerase subunit B, partial [Bacteroidales bacterium]|nr:type IIA DNA topoisomerase subunit B [Bacteroidales bacterium]
GQSVRSFVNDFVARNLDNYLRMHPELVSSIEEKIKASQEEREAISGIQKKTRERASRTSVYNKKLRDCQYHFNDKATEKNQEAIEKSSIFITEGDSASGTITKARNAEYQAVFSLRGKPLNCYQAGRRKVAENEEMNLLINALGIEEDIDGLRYNNIIVATDADDDGMHIRMLILTFFMKYYPELIRRGHVHILQTPLFRVRNKKENRYCYSEEEKQQAIAALKNSCEITRFKGLGEINAGEFADFIGEDMRLDLASLAEEESIAEIMEFYMGDNTVERQNFIRANLRTEEELGD